MFATPAGGLTGAAPDHTVRAVVTVRGGAVSAPGVRVLTVLPHVGVEVVTGTVAALAALARDPNVLGVTADDHVQLTGLADGSPKARNKKAGNGGKRGDGNRGDGNRGDGNGDAEQNGVFSWAGLGDTVGTGTAGAGVTVAVLDTGVSDTPALNRASARLVDGVDTSHLAAGGTASTTGTFTDGYGHGTFMANLIAGGPVTGVPGHHSLGVAPGARVVVVKVADDTGATSLSQVLAGMDWVAAQAPKIQVLNLALSHDRPGTAYGADPLTAAVQHLTEGGIVVIAAAGNKPGQVGDPGMAPQSLTVGAADLTGGDSARRAAVADFSGSANVAGVAKPDLVASGVGLLSLMPPSSAIAQAYPDALQANGFWRGSGTSESTAVTTGAAAVLLSKNPQARLVDVKPALRVAADEMRAGHAQGQGLLDVSDATKTLRAYTKHTGSSEDASGEQSLDVNAWNANSWLNNSWASWLSQAWAANSWAADGSWSASSWASATWGNDSWSANSWAASSWAANSWAASSWAANSWAASSWAANSWAANSWAANSWAANSWAAGSWGGGS